MHIEKWSKKFNAQFTPLGKTDADGLPSYTVHGTFESICGLWGLLTEETRRRAPMTQTTVNSLPTDEEDSNHPFFDFDNSDQEPTSKGNPFFDFDNSGQEPTSKGKIPRDKHPVMPQKPSVTSRSSKTTKQTGGLDAEKSEDDRPMSCTATTFEYVERSMQQELLEIASQCGVSIRGEPRDDGQYANIFMKPVTSNIQRAKEQLTELFAEVNNSMVEHRIPVSPEEEAEVQKLNSSEFKTLILLENRFCIILGKQQDADRAQAEVTDLLRSHRTTNKQIHGSQQFTYSLPPGCTITVKRGDITQEKVDVIVNAANENLDHWGGVAKAIAMKGGWEVQQKSYEHIESYGKLKEAEAISTTAGALQCKHIVHTVPPHWDLYSRNEQETTDVLSTTCYNSLKLASHLRASSIAIPGLGSGVFGIPKHVCAKALMHAASSFFKKHSTKSSLRTIVFIDIDSLTVQAMTEEYNKVFFGKGTQLKPCH